MCCLLYFVCVRDSANSHGTRCAGEIAMVANNHLCGVSRQSSEQQQQGAGRWLQRHCAGGGGAQLHHRRHPHARRRHLRHDRGPRAQPRPRQGPHLLLQLGTHGPSYLVTRKCTCAGAKTISTSRANSVLLTCLTHVQQNILYCILMVPKYTRNACHARMTSIAAY